MTNSMLVDRPAARVEAMSGSMTDAAGCLHALGLITECLVEEVQFESALERALSIIAGVIPGEFFLLQRMELDSLNEEFSSYLNRGGWMPDNSELNRSLQAVVRRHTMDVTPDLSPDKCLLLTERGEGRHIRLADSIHQVTLGAASHRGGWVDILLVGCPFPWSVDTVMEQLFCSVLRLIHLSREQLRCKHQESIGHRLILQAKQEWQRSVDVLPQLICLVGSDGRVLRANRTLEGMGLGTVKDVSGTGFMDLLERLGVGDELVAAEDTGSVIRGGDFPDPDNFGEARDWIWRKWWERSDRSTLIVGPLATQSGRQFELRLKKYSVPGTAVDVARDEVVCVAVLEDVTEKEKSRSLIESYNENLQRQVEEQIRQLRLINMELSREIGAHKEYELRLKMEKARTRELSDQLLVAQDTERRRIARELHDGVGQRLSTVRLRLDQFIEECGTEFEQQREQLVEIGERTQETLDEVRRVSMDLRPSLLDDLGIIATLTWFLRELRTTAPQIEVQSEIQVDETVLGTELKTQIFRIVQEAFNNIVKHADATRARLTLKGTPGRLALKIQDNGKGLDAGEGLEYAGVGLRSMLERAELSGGELFVCSRLESGVSIAAIWPG